MNAVRFDHAFLRLFSGPMIWAAHFLAIYGFAGLACARRMQDSEWLGVGVVNWVVAAVTLAAVAAVLLLWARADYKQTPRDSAGFIRWTGAALGMLSILAIVWDAMPALLIPQCA